MSLGWLSHRASGMLLRYALLLVPLGSFAAKSPKLEPLFHERTILAESFAKEKLWYWQNRLNLKDWNVSLAVVRSTELKPNTLGHIDWYTDNRTARILVLNPAEYQMPLDDILADLEFTVVHELLHLGRTCASKQSSSNPANRSDEERAVNNMTETLLKLDRGN